jgi:TolB-like protein
MDDHRGAARVYEFAGFRLAAAQRRLTARADGRAIDLTPKAFDALQYLVCHAGELLDKTTLLQAIWPNVVVEDNNLNQVISVLRRTLDGGGDERRFIVTVPGRGYQFVAAVTEAVDTRGGDERALSPGLAPASVPASIASPANRASIAVLPFVSFSNDPEKDYFGDAIAEELIHRLARVPGLKVPARTSSFAYKSRNVDARHVAHELGVSMLLEGSVRSAGDRIRVTAQLVEADSGFHVWSQTYDRQFADVFQLQDELAGAIVQALRINLGEGRTPQRRELPPTTDLDAYRLYLQARAIWFGGGGIGGRGTVAHWGDTAVELLQRSITHDRRFARSYAQLGAVQNFQFSLGVRGPEILVAAQHSVEQALALDPDLAEAHALLGSQRAARGQWLAADASFRRAIALDPAEPLTHQSYALFVLGPAGKMRQAFERSREGYRLAPANTGCALTLAGYCSLLGRDEDAMRHTGIAIDLGYGERQPPVSIFRAQAARAAGRYAEAADLVLHAIPPAIRTQGGEDVVRLVFAALADIRRAPQAVCALRALNRNGDAALLACWPMIMLTMNWYVMLGALDDAYQAAETMLGTFARTGVLNTMNLQPLWLPELRAFRRDPRFGDFTQRLGLVDYWKQQGPPDHCALRDERLIFD